MTRVSAYIVLVVLVLASCKKVPLPDYPESNSPVYTLRGQIDEDSFYVAVGENADFLCGTSIMNGVETFYGQIESTPQDFLLRVDITKPERMPIKATDGGIIKENPDFLVHNPSCIRLEFGEAYDQMNNLLVKVNDKFVPLTNISYSEFGLYHLILKFTDFGPNEFDLPVRYGFEYQDINPKFTSSGTDNVLHLTANESAYSHKWFINEELVGEENSVSVPVQDGIHKVKHLIIDEAGNELVYVTLVRFKNGQYYWQMNYSYCTNVEQSNYSKLMVSYRHGGIWYKSNKALSNGFKEIELSDVNFIGDEEGLLKMAYFNLKFAAKLKDDSQTVSVSLENVEGRMAVGLK